MNFPCKGRKVCRMHGGTSKVGAEHHRWRGDGSRSPYVPKRLSQRMDEAMLDPDILSQRRRIAQMAARVEELWEKLDMAEGAADWSQLKLLWNEMKAANADIGAATSRGDQAGVAAGKSRYRAAYVPADALIEAGAGEQFQWDEFRKAADAARRLIESERRREVESQQVLGFNQIASLIDIYTAVVRKHVSNPDERRCIAAEFVRLAGPADGRADAG